MIVIVCVCACVCVCWRIYGRIRQRENEAGRKSDANGAETLNPQYTTTTEEIAQLTAADH